MTLWDYLDKHPYLTAYFWGTLLLLIWSAAMLCLGTLDWLNADRRQRRERNR